MRLLLFCPKWPTTSSSISAFAAPLRKEGYRLELVSTHTHLTRRARIDAQNIICKHTHPFVKTEVCSSVIITNPILVAPLRRLLCVARLRVLLQVLPRRHFLRVARFLLV